MFGEAHALWQGNAEAVDECELFKNGAR